MDGSPTTQSPRLENPVLHSCSEQRPEQSSCSKDRPCLHEGHGSVAVEKQETKSTGSFWLGNGSGLLLLRCPGEDVSDSEARFGVVTTPCLQARSVAQGPLSPLLLVLTVESAKNAATG